MDERDELDVARHALAVSRRIDLDEAGEAFLRAALDYAPATAGLLYLYDPESDIFRLRSATIPPGDPGRSGLMSLDLAEMRGQGPPETWEAAVRPVPSPLRVLPGETVLVSPLAAGGGLLGMLFLADGRRAIDSGTVDRVRRLLPELLPGLLNARQVESYRELVIRDDQSDCYNRRYFDRCLSEEVYRAQRYGSALSLVFLDLDNLKEVNARFGHAVGSKTVREVSRRLVGGIRGSDRAFRYGGDEFCVVLPGTDLAGAREVCERLRLAIGSRPFVVDSTTHVPVTASFGIASYPEHARTSLGLIKCADEAMQLAKNSGKNSVRVATPGPSELARALGGGP